MTISKLAVFSLISGILLPFAIVTTIDWSYLVSPWENASRLLAIAFLAPLAAVVLGHLARKRILGRRENLAGSGFAMTGLLLGYLGLMAIPVFLVELNHWNRICVGIEGMAVGSLRTVNTAVHGYAESHPQQGFPATLSQLACQKTENANYTWCLDSALQGGTKAGYRFTYVPASSHHDGRLDSYQAFADPIKHGTYTMRHFSCDENGGIRVGKGSLSANGQSELIGD